MKSSAPLIFALVMVSLLVVAFVVGSCGKGTLDVNLASNAGAIRAAADADLQGAEAEALRMQTAQDRQNQELHRADESEVLEATRGTRIAEGKRRATFSTTLFIAASLALLVLAVAVASRFFSVKLTRGAVASIAMPVVARIGGGVSITVVPMVPNQLIVTNDNQPGVVLSINARTGESSVISPPERVVEIGARARSQDVVSGHLSDAAAIAAKARTKSDNLNALLGTVRDMATEAINPTVRVEAREVSGPIAEEEV